MLGQKLTIGDRFILVLALTMVAAFYIVYWGQSVYGNQAVVAIGGKHWRTIDLYQDGIYDVPGVLGTSQLEVHDGKIRFISSPCDTKLCIHQGWISQSGEIAACVPNTVSVRILGPDPRFDTMNF
ncbi:MAG: NusG domain II-containing protein [Gammaproteobacteria bacterium]|nr:NusG domain II-containing protein [Gammaproteobacteria bacterium]